MMSKQQKPVPLLISCSKETTESNKTGSWRFVRPVYIEKTAPCSIACPAGEDIARIEMLAHRGIYKEAWDAILMENPFPAICSRVCFHPCEKQCNRTSFDQPMAIHAIERFIGDIGITEQYAISKFQPSGSKKIAIAGSGPAGLSAGFFLARLGYECDIFEADSEPGGLLRWGIPAYRLPADIIQNEIARIENLGVRIHCGKSVNQAFLDEIKAGYDAMFIACGYGKSIFPKISGEAFANDGLTFLHKIREGKPRRIKGKAAVIGGGNTAIDVARSLIRLGAEPIIIYRRRREDMPAFGHEVEMALKEGVVLKELVAPIRIEKKNKAFLLTLQQMKTVDTDTDGRKRVIPDDGKTETIKVHHVFMAIGAEAKELWQIPDQFRGNIVNFSHCSLSFENGTIPIVFGGDLTNATKSVTDAIASGKQAAIIFDTIFQKGKEAINQTLSACSIGNGKSLSIEMHIGGNRKLRNPHPVEFEEINTDYFQPEPSVITSQSSVVSLPISFSEVESTLTREMILKESSRCFNCGICNDCDNCRLFCPEMSVFSENIRHINLDYCKGCGICVVECPRNAIGLEEEKI